MRGWAALVMTLVGRMISFFLFLWGHGESHSSAAAPELALWWVCCDTPTLWWLMNHLFLG